MRVGTDPGTSSIRDRVRPGQRRRAGQHPLAGGARRRPSGARAEAAVVVGDAQPGDYVCRVGRPVTYWFGVVEGLLKMSNDNAQGHTMTFTGVPPGGWFGEGTVLKRESYRYNIQALRKSVVAGLPVDDLPLAAGPLDRLQPLRDEPAQRAAGAVHRRARDRPHEQPRRARGAQPRGAVQPGAVSRASASCCASRSRSWPTWSGCRASA